MGRRIQTWKLQGLYDPVQGWDDILPGISLTQALDKLSFLEDRRASDPPETRPVYRIHPGDVIDPDTKRKA